MHILTGTAYSLYRVDRVQIDAIKFIFFEADIRTFEIRIFERDVSVTRIDGYAKDGGLGVV